MGGPAPPSLLPPHIEGQTYCLRWNNHKSNLVEILDALIKVESYVDCTIVVDDQVQFKAHRVVLAANSPYFQAILQDVPMDHCSIIFPGVKAFEMRALLEYMYTGEVNVTQSQIPKIMRIAEELEVKGLFDMADLKEKFNKLASDEPNERAGNPYSSLHPHSATASSTLANANSPQNGGGGGSIVGAGGAGSGNGTSKDFNLQQRANNSSSVISTSSNVSPHHAAATSSTSPPYSYKSPFANLYSKSPGPSTSTLPPSSTTAATTTLSSSASSSHAQPTQPNERAQWPLSPSAATAAMLSSVYESAPDMNPLKRKKLSSLSSMLMNRDTPILRNVLAQANPADPSQSLPLLLPGSTSALNPNSGLKTDKIPTEKNLPHATTMTATGSSHNNNHSFNGSDYGSDKKFHEEPHSPYTDRSFDDDNYEQKGGNFAGGFGASNSNQKPEWKRYKQYTRSDIMSAIQCVRDGMSALQASRKFGVPSRTLYDKVKKLGITTGRPMNRTMKRSPSSLDSSAAFPYAHGYGQTEPLLTAMHEQHDERDATKESQHHQHHHHHQHQHQHHRSESHHMPSTIPHPAAALLDHAFLQQALENRGGDMVGGREALQAMALAAAAHAAANRLSASPRHHEAEARSPSPNYGSLKYGHGDSGADEHEHEMMLEREREREREHEREREKERDMDDEDDQVEDLSVARKDCQSPQPIKTQPRPTTPYSPTPHDASHDTSPPATFSSTSNENGSSVIVPPSLNTNKLEISSSEDYATYPLITGLKRELVDDDRRSD